jgi:hypothetical protein
VTLGDEGDEQVQHEARPPEVVERPDHNAAERRQHHRGGGPEQFQEPVRLRLSVGHAFSLDPCGAKASYFSTPPFVGGNLELRVANRSQPSRLNAPAPLTKAHPRSTDQRPGRRSPPDGHPVF